MEKLSKLIKIDDTDAECASIFDTEVTGNIARALTLLEEFHGMIEMIRDDSKKMTEEDLEEFRATTRKMKTLYREIDNLEKIVKTIEESCNKVDKALQQAEAETNAFSHFRNTLRKVVSTGFQATASPVKQSILPSVFTTSDLLQSTEEVDDENVEHEPEHD